MRGEDCKLRLLKEGTKKMNLGKTANILFQEASSEFKWSFAEDWRILKVLKEEWKPKRLRLRRWRVAEEEWSGRSTDSCHPPALFCQWRSSWLLASPILCTLRWYPLSFSESSHYIVQLRHKSYISSHFADENIFVTQESQHILNGYWHMAVLHLPPDHRSSHFHTRLFHHNSIWWVFILNLTKWLNLALFRFGVRLPERPRMLRPSELLEHPEAVAAAGDPGGAAGVRPLEPRPPQHPRLRLARQEVPLGASRQYR